MEQTDSLLRQTFAGEFEEMILSSPANKDGIVKIRLRPLVCRGESVIQAEEYTKTQVFHKNMTAEEAVSYVSEKIPSSFLQGQIRTRSFFGTILANRKGTVTVKKKQRAPEAAKAQKRITLSHDRKKQYLLEEGTPVPFLVDLGVMTPEGAVVKAHYDKFRQINRFLEFIEDILSELPKDREIRILDFGCGKSYLTFAVYYYLHEKLGLLVHIVGMDLKEEVIRHCSELARAFGYDGLEFICGDVACYDGTEGIDMMMTLHACDTATDYALAKAVSLGAKVILSVPCCQHELNGMIENELLSPVLRYGILKDRLSAILTDAIRAGLLEEKGYRTQILEFIDMEHTPKNLLIRAVYTGRPEKKEESIRRLIRETGAHLTLEKLLKTDRCGQEAGTEPKTE